MLIKYVHENSFIILLNCVLPTPRMKHSCNKYPCMQDGVFLFFLPGLKYAFSFYFGIQVTIFLIHYAFYYVKCTKHHGKKQKQKTTCKMGASLSHTYNACTHAYLHITNSPTPMCIHTYTHTHTPTHCQYLSTERADFFSL